MNRTRFNPASSKSTWWGGAGAPPWYASLSYCSDTARWAQWSYCPFCCLVSLFHWCRIDIWLPLVWWCSCCLLTFSRWEECASLEWRCLGPNSHPEAVLALAVSHISLLTMASKWSYSRCSECLTLFWNFSPSTAARRNPRIVLSWPSYTLDHSLFSLARRVASHQSFWSWPSSCSRCPSFSKFVQW